MSAPRERPILFSGRMVQAILEDRKTQTRRIVRGDCQGYEKLLLDEQGLLRQGGMQEQAWTKAGRWARCPYGKPGDRLWVRETFYCDDCRFPGGPVEEMRELLYYRATDCDPAGRCWTGFSLETMDPPWRPSILMPRWASRITLEILSVRVERLQDISEEDALAEAPIFTENADPSVSDSTPVCMFAHLWDGINGSAGKRWADNPWCWAISFRRLL
jgi:hypothetical protein